MSKQKFHCTTHDWPEDGHVTMADETDTTPIEFMLALHPSLCKQLGVDDELLMWEEEVRANKEKWREIIPL